MAEYYAVLKKAVGGLELNSSDARRAVYEKARNALIGQLKAIDPPLTTSEISRQRLELEEAIRRVEREAGSSSSGYAPSNAAADTYMPAEEDPPEMEFDLDLDSAVEPADQNRQTNDRQGRTHQEAFHQAVQVAERQPTPPRTERRETPPPPPVARGPRHDSSFDVRAEPKAGVMRSPSPVGYRSDSDFSPDVRADKNSAGDKRSRGSDSGDAGRRRGGSDEGSEATHRSSRLPMILLVILIIAVLGGVGALAWSQKDFLRDVIASFDRSRSTEAPAPTGEPEASPDASAPVRDVGQGGGVPPPAQESKDQTQAGVPVAQKVTLLEESLTQTGDVEATLTGTVVWKFVPTGPDGPVVEADISVPKRGVKITMKLRKNLDAAMPASHLVEITIDNPAGLPGGGIAAIPRLVMKPDEVQKGDALLGATSKVTDSLFWIAFSGKKADIDSNIALLRQREWFDLPLLYKNKQRAILTFEKGAPGQEAFEKALAAWGN